MEPGEYEKVKAVHSFVATPGSKKRQAWEAIKKKDGAKWYILKYASKYQQKEVPTGFANVGRFWGTSTQIQDNNPQEIELTEEEVREYLSSKLLSVAKRDILPKLIIIPK
jgi:hypothetical protein